MAKKEGVFSWGFGQKNHTPGGEEEKVVTIQQEYWELKDHIRLLENQLKQKENTLIETALKDNLFKGHTATFEDGTKVWRTVTERVQGLRGKELLEAVKEYVLEDEKYIKESLDEARLIKDSKKNTDEFADLFEENGLDIEQVTTYKIVKN
jgi:predicted phage-related endonuclease